MTTSISLRGAGRRFGSAWALADVDLDLAPGVTGLLGPNGAGKTTLLRLFATALSPTQGTVSVLGLDPAEPAQRTGIRRRLGYLPQEIGFPRGFSAFADGGQGARPAGSARRGHRPGPGRGAARGQAALARRRPGAGRKRTAGFRHRLRRPAL